MKRLKNATADKTDNTTGGRSKPPQKKKGGKREIQKISGQRQNKAGPFKITKENSINKSVEKAKDTLRT